MDRKRSVAYKSKTKARKDAKLRKEFVTQSELKQLDLIAEVQEMEERYFKVREGLTVGFAR